MKKIDSAKTNVCVISELGRRLQSQMSQMEEKAAVLRLYAKDAQAEMNALIEHNANLIEALKRIAEGELIVKPTGTIYMDEDETQTLHSYIENVLKTWG